MAGKKGAKKREATQLDLAVRKLNKLRRRKEKMLSIDKDIEVAEKAVREAI